MKTIYVLIASAMLVGCAKEMPMQTSGKNAEKVSEMSVPASFDWETTADAVVCKVSSDKVSRISVSTSAADEPFATFFAGGSLDAVELSLPVAVNTLYMSYETVDGKMSAPQAVPVAANTVVYKVGDNNRPFDDSDMEQVDNTIFIPARANGWGTMLFEDLWPGMGDYDFNDFVFNYKVQLALTGSNKIEALQIGIRMKAVSGSLPYELYLQMHGVRHDQIESVEQVAARNTTTAALTLLPPPDPNKNRALFRFDGIKHNPNKQSGAIWVNTESGYELSDDQLVEASYVIYFTEPIELKNVNFAGMDFFLGQVENGVLGAEIHRCNYEPINEAYYMEKADPTVRDYYKTKNNLVWAVNIPMDVAHVYEKVDFLKAYPEFKTWAQSAGTLSRDWYEKGVKEYQVKKK